MDSYLTKLFHDTYPQDLQVPFNYCEGVWLTTDFLDMKEEIRNFEIRDDDIWLCGFPKTGTTWSQEMTWCIANGLDSERVSENILVRFPDLGNFILPNCTSSYVYRKACIKRRNNEPIFGLGIQDIKQLPSPRFIKTHLPYHLLPKQLIDGKTKAKVIYVSRNPKDTCISSYHFQQLAASYCGTFENFCELFMGDKVDFAPFWNHIISYWTKKDSMNILFIKYEDMKTDLRSIIQRVAKFLNKHIDDKQIRTLEDHLSFTKMKSNPAVNYEFAYGSSVKTNEAGSTNNFVKAFIRKGEINQWKTKMPDSLVEKFDNWTNENLHKYPEIKLEFC